MKGLTTARVWGGDADSLDLELEPEKVNTELFYLTIQEVMTMVKFHAKQPLNHEINLSPFLSEKQPP